MPNAPTRRGATTRGAVAFEKATQNNRWTSANIPLNPNLATKREIIGCIFNQESYILCVQAKMLWREHKINKKPWRILC